MNGTESIISELAVTQRNALVVGRWCVWMLEPLCGAPRLYFADSVSLLCDGKLAYRIGGLLTSEYQARFWCAYHGFEFAPAEFLPKTESLLDRVGRANGLRVSALSGFDVQRYEVHRQRCPDCRRRARKSVGAPVWESVEGKGQGQ